jgi:hypothetical protein
VSYHHYNGSVVRRSLGDTTADEISCLNKANASPQVSSIDETISNLSKTWNPTGYFRPADIQQVLDMLADQAADAGAAVAGAPLSTSDAKEAKAQAFDDLMYKYKDRSVAYVKAIADAKSSGVNAINAPAFKSFVLSSMRALSDAYVVATVLECRQTWVEKWLDRAYQAIMAIAALVAKLVGIVLKVGEAAVDAADTAASILAAIVKYSPWIALGIGGYLLYGFVAKK